MIPHYSLKEFSAMVRAQGRLSEPVLKAISIVEKYFHTVPRDDGSRYTEQHLYPIAVDVMEYFGSSVHDEYIIAALFHDLYEDTSYTAMKEDFPTLHLLIDQLVLPVTKQYKARTKEEKMMRSKEYLTGILRAPYPAQVIKVFDRINNVQCVGGALASKRAYYLKETKELYLPFARKVDSTLFRRLEEIYYSQGGK